MPSGWIWFAVVFPVFLTLALYVALRKKNKPPPEPEQSRPSLNEALQRRVEEMPPGIDPAEIFKKFQGRYRERYASVSVPRRALYVDKVIDIFSLKNVRITHYCWKSDGLIHTFPVWDSIVSKLRRSKVWVLAYHDGDENNISKLIMPVSKIRSFAVMAETGDVLLRHTNFAGQEIATVFRGKYASSTFETLIPEKQLAFVRRRVYLSSPKNISDMSGEISSLRDRLLRGDISREEYERLKIACVLRM